MKYGQVCNSSVGVCIFWFQSPSSKRYAVIRSDGNTEFPYFVDNVQPTGSDALSMPEWAHQYAVSRDWTDKYRAE